MNKKQIAKKEAVETIKAENGGGIIKEGSQAHTVMLCLLRQGYTSSRRLKALYDIKSPSRVICTLRQYLGMINSPKMIRTVKLGVNDYVYHLEKRPSYGRQKTIFG